MSIERSDSRVVPLGIALSANPSDASDLNDPHLAVGWTNAAIAVRSILQLSFPMFLCLRVDGHSPILIDFRHRAFTWGTPLDAFPASPGYVNVETEATTLTAAPLFTLPGQDVDGLLWMMGSSAFDGAPATWLAPGDRYRLSRWPNIIQLGITPEQVRMTALLGSGFFTARELALASGTDVASANRLINAFTLMNIAYSSADAPATLVQRPEARVGLFRRLREKLGI
jgi:hypothetical protein